MKQIHLKQELDAKGHPTGDLICSECGLRFRPDPTNPVVHNFEFGKHVEYTHGSRDSRREDVNQTAARIVRKATEEH